MVDGDEEEEPPLARRVDCDLMLIVGMFPVEDESPVLGLDLCLIGLVETCLAFMADRFCRLIASFSHNIPSSLDSPRRESRMKAILETRHNSLQSPSPPSFFLVCLAAKKNFSF